MRNQNVAYAFESLCQRHLPGSRHIPAFETWSVFQMLRKVLPLNSWMKTVILVDVGLLTFPIP